MARALIRTAPRRCGGAAIVIAMLLAALAATIAATLLWQQQRWINEHAHRRDQVQAQALAMAGVQWARQIVNDNAGGGIVHLGQPWALKLPALPIENGSIAGYIVDAQSRININNIAGVPAAPAPTRTALQRLFAALALPPSLLNAIGDWVDADDVVSEPGGAEDAWYLSQPQPGLAANAPVRRTSELLAVRGVDPGSLARLLPLVSALDAPTAVNVNTAPPEVLAAVVGGLDAAGAASLVASRAQTPFANIADFRARLRPDVVVDETLIDVKSDWFEVSIEARQGDTLARARALLRRAPAANTWPSVVWEVVE
ncbi:MAG TPA: type II secretion system minor pseudopilin GspK [Casimicrobiaceae bacterium]|jgi:general secretion pathway protein K|nr:type II secretion system minor pseudopilin GspK [Casimicrobiaceae bacterium]